MLLITKNDEKRYRIATIIILAIVLSTSFWKPRGLINFEKFESKNLLIAQREGAANCTTTYKLKEDKTFKEINVCFAISEIIGTYRISNDTIYFENIKKGVKEDFKYKFGIIEELEIPVENKYALRMFKNQHDTLGSNYFISRNELNIKPLTKSYK